MLIVTRLREIHHLDQQTRETSLSKHTSDPVRSELSLLQSVTASILLTRWILLAGCCSPDGSKLACTEGREVVVCDESTGFVQKTLRGHRYTLFLCFGHKNFPYRCTFSSDWDGVTFLVG